MNFKISVEEQLFLMEWFEVKDPELSVTLFLEILAKEGILSQELPTYLKKVMKRMNI